MGRYAKVTDGLVENIIVADAEFAAKHGYIEAPAGVGIGWSHDGTTYTAPPKPAPTQEELKRGVDAERDRRISAGFTWNGKTFQSDEDSRENITGAATSATAYIVMGGSPDEVYWDSPDTPFYWLATDNSLVQMTPVQVIEFGNAAKAHKKSTIFAARALKDMATIPADYADDKYWP